MTIWILKISVKNQMINEKNCNVKQVNWTRRSSSKRISRSTHKAKQTSSAATCSRSSTWTNRAASTSPSSSSPYRWPRKVTPRRSSPWLSRCTTWTRTERVYIYLIYLTLLISSNRSFLISSRQEGDGEDNRGDLRPVGRGAPKGRQRAWRASQDDYAQARPRPERLSVRGRVRRGLSPRHRLEIASSAKRLIHFFLFIYISFSSSFLASFVLSCRRTFKLYNHQLIVLIVFYGIFYFIVH